jgi:hypothetical protein
MLGAIGEMPVNDLDEDSDVSEASIARGILHEVSREIQDQGLECNTESDYPMVIDTNGYVYLSENILHLDPTDRTMKVVQRGNRLYDKENHTFIFTKSVDCEVTWFFAYEDLPQHVQSYIKEVAIRRFVGRVLGDQGLKSLSDDDLVQAKAQFMRGETATDDRTLLDAVGMYAATRRY